MISSLSIGMRTLPYDHESVDCRSSTKHRPSAEDDRPPERIRFRQPGSVSKSRSSLVTLQSAELSIASTRPRLRPGSAPGDPQKGDLQPTANLSGFPQENRR